MTTADNKLWLEGKGYYEEYVKLFGFTIRLNNDKLKTLARQLDINKKHLSICIVFYLEN